MPARREVHVEASREEIWEAMSTDEGREDWLEEETARSRSSSSTRRRDSCGAGREREPATGRGHARGRASATRVLVSESTPSFPITRFAELRVRCAA